MLSLCQRQVTKNATNGKQICENGVSDLNKSKNISFVLTERSLAVFEISLKNTKKWIAHWFISYFVEILIISTSFIYIFMGSVLTFDVKDFEND